MWLTSSASILKKQIRDLHSSNVVLQGQIGNLQTEWQRSEESVAKYKRRWKKLKKEKEASEAERVELQHQLEETSIKIEAETVAGNEKAAKAE